MWGLGGIGTPRITHHPEGQPQQRSALVILRRRRRCVRQPLPSQTADKLCGKLGLERCRLRGPVSLVERHSEATLPHLSAVAHGADEGGVAAGSLRELAEDALGQNRVGAVQLGAEAADRHVAQTRLPPERQTASGTDTATPRESMSSAPTASGKFACLNSYMWEGYITFTQLGRAGVSGIFDRLSCDLRGFAQVLFACIT